MKITIKDTTRVEDAFDSLYQGRTKREEVLDKEGEVTGKMKTVELHTKSEWVDVCVKKHINEVVEGYETNKAADEAREVVKKGFISVL